MKYQNFTEVLAISPSPLNERTPNWFLPELDTILRVFIHNDWEEVVGVRPCSNGSLIEIHYRDVVTNLTRLCYASLLSPVEFEVLYTLDPAKFNTTDPISDYDRAMSIL